MPDLAEFKRQGYLVLPGAIPPADLESIRQAAARIVEDFDAERHRSVFSTSDRDRGRDLYFMDSAESVHCFLEEEAVDEAGNLLCPKPQAINKIGHALHDLVPEFTDFCRLPLFAGILAELGYERPQLWQSMYIYKQPKIGGEVRWHQDASYLRSLSSPVVGFWVAVEDATLENGCLWVEPGGHDSPLREVYEVDPRSRKGVLKTIDETPWPSTDKALPIEIKAGGVIVFSDRLPHYSSANRSNRSRQAFTLHFSEHDAEWSPLNWLQRNRLPPFYLST
jgi:phytanoyl-CoA hydroxylase